MIVKSGSVWNGLFVTVDATGALATPSAGPTGKLYVDGVANSTTVTITGSNPYKFSVTLPSLTAGQHVDMYITATISSIATAGIVASAQADTVLLSDGVMLADDAITAAKFDESTAFPLKAADIGETQIARTGADGDTLEKLSDEIAAKMASSEVIEGTYTLKDAIRIILAFAAGKVSGGGTASIKFRSTGDDVDRIQATVDSSGNRTAVTLNPNDPI